MAHVKLFKILSCLPIHAHITLLWPSLGLEVAWLRRQCLVLEHLGHQNKSTSLQKIFSVFHTDYLGYQVHSSLLYRNMNTGYTGFERQIRAFSRYTLSVEALSAEDASAVQQQQTQTMGCSPKKQVTNIKFLKVQVSILILSRRTDAFLSLWQHPRSRVADSLEITEFLSQPTFLKQK